MFISRSINQLVLHCTIQPAIAEDGSQSINLCISIRISISISISIRLSLTSEPLSLCIDWGLHHYIIIGISLPAVTWHDMTRHERLLRAVLLASHWQFLRFDLLLGYSAIVAAFLHPPYAVLWSTRLVLCHLYTSKHLSYTSLCIIFFVIHSFIHSSLCLLSFFDPLYHQALGYMCDVMDPDRVDNGTIGLILSAIIDGMRADRPNEVRTLLENLTEIARVKPVTLHSTLLD